MQRIIEQMPQWDAATVWIYVGSVIAAFIFASIYNQRKFVIGRSKEIWLCFSFLSLWVVLAFSTCGADYAAYERIFNSSLDPSYWAVARVEKGYILFCAIFKAIGINYKVFHMIWAFVFLLLIYMAFSYYKDHIDVGIAVLAFGGLYCFQSMNLMRLYLAMAFTVVCYKNYMEDKKARYLIDLIIALFIHRSSICLMIPLAFSIIFPSRRSVLVKVISSGLVIGAFYMFRGYIFSTMSLFDNAYALTESTSFGIANIIYHIPLAIMLVYAYKKQKYESDAFQKYFIMFLCSFIIGTVSYFVSMLGRMFVYFAPLYMLFPAYVVSRENESETKRFVLKVDSISLIKIMYIAFILFRAFMMTEFFYTDQIMPYTSIFSM